MTTIDWMSRAEAEEKALSERAFRAVRRQNELLPVFTSAARAMTGRADVVVLSGPRSETDGRRIWLRVNIELGDYIEHVRSICARRDPETSHPLCPACRQMESVQRTLFHELSHIIFETFQPIEDGDRSRAMGRMLTEFPGAKGSRLEKIQAEVRRTISLSANQINYMGLASIVSPYLPTIINALEDARVNRCMYRVRSGTYHMFRSGLIDVFEDGIRMLDGTVQRWEDRDENAQAIIGVLCKACGLSPRDGWLTAPVVTAMADPALTSAIDALEHTALTAADIYRASFDILEHLRRLGFCRRPDDAEDDEPEQQPEPPQQEQEGESDDSQDDEPGPGMAEEGDGPEQDSESDASEPSADSDGDSADDADDVPGDDGEQSDNNDNGGSESDDSAGSDELPDDSDGDSGDGSSDEQSGGESDDESDEAGESEDEDSPSTGGKPTPGSDEQESDGEADDSDSEGDDDSSVPSGNGPDSASSPPMDASPDAQQDDDPAGEGDEADDSEAEPEPTPVDEQAAQQRMMDTDPEVAKKLLLMFGGHDEDSEKLDEDTNRQLGIAVIQAEMFDNASSNVSQVNVHHFEKPDSRSRNLAWRCQGSDDDDRWTQASGDSWADFEMPESLVGPALLKMRTIFADNAKAKRSGELRSGRVVATKLASVMAGNTRVFNRKLTVAKKDYFVVLALDVSASTTGDKLFQIKQMGMAFGNLLSRAGVRFAIYAHTGGYVSGDHMYEADVFVIKEEHDPWDDKARNRLAKLNSAGNNLDGHALEFFRKRCDKSSATDKVIFYVTDGSMPEANHDDEYTVLLDELVAIKRRGYTLIGVGMHTDSPSQYGLDTICIDHPKDIQLLIRELEKRLAVKR